MARTVSIVLPTFAKILRIYFCAALRVGGPAEQ